MQKKLFIDAGGHLQERGDDGSAKVVPFPVCLAIKHAEDISETCPNFVLNLDEGWVFIGTGSPLPEGAFVQMHFYIPPENKLLAELSGSVVAFDRNSAYYPEGMLIKFARRSRKELESLEKYIEGNKRLIDKKA
jgi:hypothetical protein